MMNYVTWLGFTDAQDWRRIDGLQVSHLRSAGVLRLHRDNHGHIILIIIISRPLTVGLPSRIWNWLGSNHYWKHSRGWGQNNLGLNWCFKLHVIVISHSGVSLKLGNHVIITIRPLPNASFLSILSRLASDRNGEIQTKMTCDLLISFESLSVDDFNPAKKCIIQSSNLHST